MKLIMGTFEVKRIEWATRTLWQSGTLLVNIEELRDLILSDATFEDVSIEIVYPGERTRIVHVLDAVEPRVKVEGASGCFPGFLGPAHTAGSGTTHRLSGVAVLGIAIDLPSGNEAGVLTFTEGIIDMSGPAERYCACSDTINLCLCFKMQKGYSYSEFDSSTRRAILKTADYLARCTIGLLPDEMEVYELSPADSDLVKIVYINQIQSQGLFCRTFLYSAPMDGSFTPTLLHPNELLDGAVVSGNYRNSFKACTFLQQNNPVVIELLRRHGKDVNFLGQIIGRGHFDDFHMKERQGYYAAKLASLLGAQTAILTMEGTGNAFIDYMLTVRALEQSGIPAVPILNEHGGVKGDEPPLVYHVPEAVSIVTGGGVDRPIEVPSMDRVVGGESIKFPNGEHAFKPIDSSSSFFAILTNFYCGYWQMQRSGMSALDY